MIFIQKDLFGNNIKCNSHVYKVISEKPFKMKCRNCGFITFIKFIIQENFINFKVFIYFKMYVNIGKKAISDKEYSTLSDEKRKTYIHVRFKQGDRYIL